MFPKKIFPKKIISKKTENKVSTVFFYLFQRINFNTIFVVKNVSKKNMSKKNYKVPPYFMIPKGSTLFEILFNLSLLLP